MFHWEEHIRKLPYMFFIDCNTNCLSLQISLKLNLAMNEVVFDKNTDSTMSVDTIFIICWIMFKCLYLISFKHGFLQTYSSRWIFWYNQLYVFSITPKTSTVPLDNVVVSHDLWGCIFFFRLGFVLSCCFNCARWLWEGLPVYCCTISATLGRTRGSLTCVVWETGSPCGRLISLTGPPASRLGSVGREGRDLR